MTVTNFADAERAAIQAARHGSNSDGPPLPFTEFADTEWAEIKAACVQEPDIDWTKVRRDLAWWGRSFWRDHGDRKWLTVIRELERLENAVKQIHEIKALIRSEYWASFTRLLRTRDLGMVLAEAEDSLEMVYEICRSKTLAVRRRSDSNRELLYTRIIEVWVGGIGAELGYGESGLLVRFMTAVLTPIVGDQTPRPPTLRNIIRRNKKKRQELQTKIDRRNQKRRQTQAF